MDEQVYQAIFERKIIRHCTPTLAGIKPANMFVCRDDSVPELRARCSELPLVDTQTYEHNVQYAIRESRAKLAPCGVRIELLARRRTGVLLYVYRPDLLSDSLSQPRTVEYLSKCGYDTDSLASCIELLHRRICGTDVQSLLSGACSFPHEIGFFLGYPYEDVIGFINNKGENYLCFGCWKVYTRARDAQECFCRYKTCTAHYEALFDRGASLESLAMLEWESCSEVACAQAG